MINDRVILNCDFNGWRRPCFSSSFYANKYWACKSIFATHIWSDHLCFGLPTSLLPLGIWYAMLDSDMLLIVSGWCLHCCFFSSIFHDAAFPKFTSHNVIFSMFLYIKSCLYFTNFHLLNFQSFFLYFLPCGFMFGVQTIMWVLL